MDGEGAENARVGQSVVTKRQENGLDLHRPKAGRPGLGADEERLGFVGDAMKDRIELLALVVAPKLEKGEAPELLHKDRIRPRSGDPERKSAPLVEIEHERIGEHAADRAGIDVVALGRAARSPEPVPVRVELRGDGELHL